MHSSLSVAMALTYVHSQAADLSSTTRCLLLILHLLRTTPSAKSPSWDQLNEMIVSLSKKHGQLKQATVKMVGAAMCYLHAPGIGESGKKEEEVTKEVEMEDAKKKEEAKAKDEARAKKEEADKSSGSKDEKTEKKKKMQEAMEVEDKGEGKEHEGVSKWMARAKEIGDQGVTEPMKVKLLETIRQVTEGKVR